MSTRSRARIAGSAVAALALVISGFVASAPPAAAAPCTQKIMTVVAHEDDDLIFINPDIVNDIHAGRCVRTLFVTAGDAGNPYPDSLYRENGPEAAYAQMAGVADSWATIDDGVSGRSLTVRALVGAPDVTIAFLRLPDGFPSGSGSSTYSAQSLLKLWNGAISSIRAVDGSETYTRSTLIDTIAAMMTAYQPSIIRTQDYVSPVTDADHSDHLMTGAFTRAASNTYTTTHTTLPYQGYATSSRPENVSGADLTAKQAALGAADEYDPGAADPWVAPMVRRKYILSESSTSPTPTPSATPTASASPTTSAPPTSSASPTASATPTTTVTAQSSNRAPVSAAGPDQAVSTGTQVTLNGTGSNDPDSDTLTYAWSQTSGPTVTLSSTTAASPTFTAPAAGSAVTFSLVVRDGALNSPADTVTISVAASNSANVARTLNATATASTQNSGDGQTAAKAIDGSPLGYPTDYSREWVTSRQGAGAWIQLTWNQTVSLDHVVLYDRPNASDQITSGTLTFSDGTSVSVGALNNDGTAVVAAFAAKTITWARFTVDTVRAGGSSIGLAEFEAWGTAAGAAPNRAPVAAAGPDQAVSTGTQVTLNGTGSNDPDSDTLTYAWSQTSGPTVTLSSTTAASPTFTAPAAGSAVTFSLVVRDGALNSPADTVTISVAASNSANVARTLNATATASTQNSGDGQTAAKAIDGSPLGYPTDYSREWVTSRQGAGAWIQLTWNQTVSLDHVVLYDRPNASDQITSGTLTFSDGTSVSVGALNNDGTAVVAAFAAKTITWARFTVDTVRAGGSSIGLAEFEAWGTAN